MASVTAGSTRVVAAFVQIMQRFVVEHEGPSFSQKSQRWANAPIKIQNIVYNKTGPGTSSKGDTAYFQVAEHAGKFFVR